jgi:hypothetical protein
MVKVLSGCVGKFRKMKEDHILFIIQMVANIWKNAGNIWVSYELLHEMVDNVMSTFKLPTVKMSIPKLIIKK